MLGCRGGENKRIRWQVDQLRTAQAKEVNRHTRRSDWELIGLLGHFSHDLTAVVDNRLGSEWAENDEILTMLALRHDMGPTTRELADVGGMNRRSVSRLVSRLRHDGLVTTSSSPSDRRSVVVELTVQGKASFRALDREVGSLFEAHRGTAAQICDVLRSGPPRNGIQHDPLDLLELLVRAGAELASSVVGAAGESMTGSQRTALVRIAAEPGIRPVDLVPALGFGRSGVAYVVDQLCAKGLVTRSRDAVAEDGRAVVLALTAEGLSAARSVNEAATSLRLRFGPLFAEVRDWEESPVGVNQ